LPKGDNHVCPSISRVINNERIFCAIIQHFSKRSPIPTQCVHLHRFYVDDKEFYDTYMFAWACQRFCWSLFTCFSLVIHLQCVPLQWDVIESLICTLRTTP
jgi:hypothetical protein